MAIKKYNFTDEMNEEIKKAYQTKVRIKTKNNPIVIPLAKKFNVSRWSISKQASKLGVLPTGKTFSLWIKEEEEILEKYAHLSSESIKNKLAKKGYKRTIAGIRQKRSRSKLYKNLDGYSASSLSECFGIMNKVVIKWIKFGLLKASKRETKRSENKLGDIYWITNKDVRNFIINHVNEIDFRKVDKYWLVDILVGDHKK